MGVFDDLIPDKQEEKKKPTGIFDDLIPDASQPIDWIDWSRYEDPYAVPEKPMTLSDASGRAPLSGGQYETKIREMKAEASRKALEDMYWNDLISKQPGWAGSIQRFKEQLPILVVSILQTAADVPAQLYQRTRYGPQFGKYGKDFKAPPHPYKDWVEYSWFTDSHEPKEGESLFKQEVKRGLAEHTLMPWLTVLTGETGKDEDPEKAKSVLNWLEENDWITESGAKQVSSFRTFGEYWYEDPFFVVLDAAIIAEPLLKLPGFVATKAGRNLKIAQVVDQVSKTTPEFASHVRKMSRRIPGDELFEYVKLAAEEALPDAKLVKFMESLFDVPGKTPTRVALSKLGDVLEKWGVGERPPIKFQVEGGEVAYEGTPRFYSKNILVRGAQWGTEKARKASPLIDRTLGFLEEHMGMKPVQKDVDWFMRSIDPIIEADLYDVTNPLRAAVAKVPKHEYGPFFDVLEATTIDKMTGKFVVGPTKVKVGKATAAALDQWKLFLKEFSAWHDKMGIPIGETLASWNTRAKDLFVQMGGIKGQQAFAGMDDAAKVAALDAEWMKLARDPKTGHEFLVKWRKKAKEYFYKRELPEPEGVKPFETEPIELPDPFDRGTPTEGGQAGLQDLTKERPGPVPEGGPAGGLFAKGEKVEIPDKIGHENLTVVSDTGKGTVKVKNIRGKEYDVGRKTLRRIEEPEAPPTVPKVEEPPAEVVKPAEVLEIQKPGKEFTPGAADINLTKMQKDTGFEIAPTGELLGWDGKKYPYYAGRLPLDVIKRDPAVYQFKSGVTETGVKAGSTYAKRPFNEALAGNIVIHERLDGSFYVAHGHHRIEHALVAPNKPIDVPVHLVREADGITPPMAYEIGVMQNIANKTAEPADIAAFLKTKNIDLEGAAKALAKGGVNPTVNELKVAYGLMELDGAVFDAVMRGLLEDKFGAVIGQELGKFPAEYQIQAAEAVMNGKVKTVADLQEYSKRVADQEWMKQNVVDLFGETAVDVNVSEEMFAISNPLVKGYAEKKATHGKAIKKKGILEEAEGTKIGAEHTRLREQAADFHGFLKTKLDAKAGNEVKAELGRLARELHEGKNTLKEAQGAFETFVKAEKDRQIPGGIRGGDAGDIGPSAIEEGPKLPGFDDIVKGQEGFLNIEPAQRFFRWFSENTEPQRKAVGDFLRRVGKRKKGETVDYEIDGTYWFPHLSKDKKGMGTGIVRTDNLPGKPGKMGHQMVRTGADDWLKDPVKIGELLSNRLKSYAKDEAVHKFLFKHVARDEAGNPMTLGVNDPIPDGWMAYYADGRKHFYRAQFDFLEAMRLELQKGPAQTDPLMAGLREMLKEGGVVKEVMGVKDARFYMVPADIGKRVRAHMTPLAVPELVRNWRNTWVDGVLTGVFAGRWQLNNFVGNVMMSVLDGSIWGVPRALRMRKQREIMELIPEVTGGGFYKTQRGGMGYRLYDDSTFVGKLRKGRKWLSEGIYEMNSVIDDSVRIAAFWKRLKPELEAHMRRTGYKNPGTFFLDSIDNLPTDELAQVMRETFDANPQLKAQLGQDVAKNVYDFALKSPTDKWMAANTHPFLPWWKFVNSWALHLAVESPYKLGLMNQLGQIGVDINREVWKNTLGEDIWDKLPEEYKYVIPVAAPDENGDMRVLVVRGGNPFHDLISVSQLVKGTAPWIQTGVKVFGGVDLFRGRGVRGEMQTAFTGNVPATYADQSMLERVGASAWWIFTDVIPYGNTGEFLMNYYRPYGVYDTATPWDPQPIYAQDGSLKYEYDEDVGSRLSKLFGINFRLVGKEDIGRDIKQRIRDWKEVERRRRRKEAIESGGR